MAKYLVKGRNHLGIHLASANNQLKKFPMLPGALSLTSFNLETLWLRKPAHVWGWDIAPRMALGGIWRNVYLAETAEHRFEDIFLDTVEVSAKQARLHLYLKEFQTKVEYSFQAHGSS